VTGRLAREVFSDLISMNQDALSNALGRLNRLFSASQRYGPGAAQRVPARIQACREIARIAEARGAPIFSTGREPSTWDVVRQKLLQLLTDAHRQACETAQADSDPKSFELQLVLEKQLRLCEACRDINAQRVAENKTFFCAATYEDSSRAGQPPAFRLNLGLDPQGHVKLIR